MPLLANGNSGRLDAFVRYEFINTQADVPTGVTADEANDRTVVTGGVTFRPTAAVAFKADYAVRRNAANAGEGEQLALGIGFALITRHG